MINLASARDEGAIKALDHNASDWTTRSDGERAFGNRAGDRLVFALSKSL